MKTKLLLAAGMLSAVVSANAQITKHRKYDWGWSYKLEMPETGLKCEFPAKPTTTTLAYGYMVAAANADELYMTAKMENPNPYDIQCRTEEFVDEMEQIHGLPVGDLQWNAIRTENGNLTISANAVGGYADFHVDAIATDDVITIFIYSNHEQLSVPGHFFASSYSAYDTPEGTLTYQADAKIQKTSGKSITTIKGTQLTTAWPSAPTVSTDRHQTTYSLQRSGNTYRETIVQLESGVSYMQFITFVNREELRNKQAHINSDQSETISTKNDELVMLRKVSSNDGESTFHRTYAVIKDKIVVQEVATSTALTNTDKRFLNSLDESIRTNYGPVFVSK